MRTRDRRPPGNVIPSLSRDLVVRSFLCDLTGRRNTRSPFGFAPGRPLRQAHGRLFDVARAGLFDWLRMTWLVRSGGPMNARSPFDRLRAGSSTGSGQALRQAQDDMAARMRPPASGKCHPEPVEGPRSSTGRHRDRRASGTCHPAPSRDPVVRSDDIATAGLREMSSRACRGTSWFSFAVHRPPSTGPPSTVHRPPPLSTVHRQRPPSTAYRPPTTKTGAPSREEAPVGLRSRART